MLVEGQDKSRVVENLGKLTKQPPEIVEQKLFSGKAVVIKQVDDMALAEKYRLAFSRAGAIVEIVGDAVSATPQTESSSIDVTETNTPPVEQPVADQPPDEIPRKPVRLIKILASVLVVIVAAAGGAYYWLTTSMLDMQAPPSVQVIEQALAEPEMMAIAYVNLAKSIELQNTFLDIDPGEELLDPNGKGMVADLQKAGIDIQHSATHLVAAFYVKEPQTNDQQTASPQAFNPAAAASIETWGNLVLLGDFPVKKIRNYLTKQYETEKVTLGGYELLQFKRQDINTCKYSTTRVIQISPHRLVISEPTHAAHLLDRLKNKAVAGIDISRWQGYRKQHLFSVGIIAPQNSKYAARGLIGMMIAGMQKKIGPVESIYAGGKVSLMPPSLAVNTSFNSSKQTWINETSTKWQHGLSKFKQQMVEESPPLASMLENLSVSSAPGDLEVELKVDKELGKNGGQVFQDLLAKAFTGGTSLHTAVINAQQKEQLDKDPLPFNTNYKFGKLPSYRDLEFVPSKHSWTDGPFMIDVEKLALDKNNNIEIQLKSEARGLVNIGNLRKNLFLQIVDAVDRNGQSILKQEKCGRDRNDKAVPFGLVMRTSNPTTPDSNPSLVGADKKIHYTQTSASKTAHLADDASLDNLEMIKGLIELDQPTSLEVKTLASPLAGQHINFQGMRLSLKGDAGGNLTFNVSGDKSKLLDVVALNKDKKPLHSGSSSSMSAFIGSSTAYSYDYSGDIAFLKVVLVKKSVHKRFPFEIHQLLQQSGNDQVHESEPMKSITRSQYHARFAKFKMPSIREKASWMGEPVAGFNQGPLALALYHPQLFPHFGAQGNFKLNLPLVPGLSHNLSGVEMLIDLVTTATGNNHTVNISDFIDVSRPIKYTMNGKPVYKEGMAVLEGMKSISIRYGNDTGAITSIEGKVLLRLPTKLEHIHFGKPELGKQKGSADTAVRLISISRNGMTFEVKGDPSKLARISVLNKDGKPISYNLQLKNDKNVWKAEMYFTGTPANVEIVTTPSQEVVSYPFVLKLASH